MNKKILVSILSAISVQAFAAGQAQTTFPVTAFVGESCIQEVKATDLSFGAYDPLSGTDATMTNEISLHCSNGTNYTLALSTGQNFDTGRNMKGDNGSFLGYQIYQPNNSQVWGDGNTYGEAYAGTATGVAETITANGVIPAGQTATANTTYSDVITVTLNY